MKKITILITVIMLLTGCGSSTYDKAMENAKVALANREFDEAMALSKLALEEKTKDEKALTMHTYLEEFNEVNKAMDEKAWDVVLKRTEEMEKEEGLPYSIAQELKNISRLASANQKNEKAVSEKMKEIDLLVANQEFQEAQAKMEALQKDEKLKAALEDHSEEINSLSSEISGAVQKTADDEKIKDGKETALTTEKALKEQDTSLKTHYLNKLAQIEIGLSDLKYLYADGVTSQMLEGEAETLKRWDDALNEIYGVLKERLSTEDMARLREEQRDWILFRDYEADLAASEFEGGSFEEVQRLSTLGQLTKDRCYLLVDYYLN
ncbi:lysozyme inhibitor LprI family protein [Planococcus shenhongbingii]|uniref:Lysozyme inhibitor LprI family protein n=1 Tax=Planococcus shenhongbingii TaxID=3058398 RepID=A0ABT8NGP1_9BACL|nr:lysozyme inhibitor LprI family protein [Planococcus sp. N017]MDN7247077.1 lysozyme inhibitor LprI family protein [Planococcus sp. N017]